MHRTLPALCVLLCACGILGPDVGYENLRLLDPIPEEYPGWYAEVESCLSRAGDFDAITWYVADDVFLDGDKVYRAWYHIEPSSGPKIKFVARIHTIDDPSECERWAG